MAIFKAIHALPSLKNIDITFSRQFLKQNCPPAGSLRPLPIFSNLQSISLREVDWDPLVPGPQDPQRRMSVYINQTLAACPCLEHLKITKRVGATNMLSHVYFADIVGDVPKASGFRATLKELVVDGVMVGPALEKHPRILEYLANLTSLDLGRTVFDDDGIWTSFPQKENIRLKAIAVPHATIGLVNYLHCYQGLEELYIRPDSRVYDANSATRSARDDLLQSKFLSALTNQSNSLRILRFQGPPNSLVQYAVCWCLDEPLIGCLKDMTSLQTLEVAFMIDTEGEGAHITLVSRDLTRAMD